MTFATIDIGTNTVLLLIAKKEAEVISAITERAFLTRLGEGVRRSQRLQPAAMERTLAALEECRDLCQKHQANPVIVVGTAAMRMADNSQDFITQVKRRCSFEIQIIDGDKEAYLSFLPSIAEFGEDVVVMDIGGGSTEFIWKNEDTLDSFSLPVGSVTLFEGHSRHDPITSEEVEKIRSEIRTALAVLPHSLGVIISKRPLIGIAGTVTTLAAMSLQLAEYDHNEVHGYHLFHRDVSHIINRLEELSIEERKKLPGLEAKRADVILPGALILDEAMKQFRLTEVIASHKGIRWGLAMEYCLDK